MNRFWITFAAALLSLIGASSHSEPTGAEFLGRVDHLVYATPDLSLGIAKLETLLGVRATPGGQHPGRGTRNALIALGPSSYLEIIGPDPEQPKPEKALNFGIDGLGAPKLVTWAANGTDLEQLATEAARQGFKLGQVRSGSRQRPDGVVLSWRLTDPLTVVADGIVPFFIDWGTTPHPSRTAAPGVTLVDLRAEHPDAERVQKMLGQIGLHLPVRPGPKPALIATVTSPRGRVELQ